MKDKYEKDVFELPIMSLISYDEQGEFEWKSVCGLLTITGISVVQYSIIITCAYQMYSNMREKLSSMSSQHRRIHRQFFKALLIQTFAPTICLFAPALFMLSVPYAGLEISFPSSVFSSLFTVYPAIDSICIMSCVSEYGRYVKSWLT
uniref:G protein-coupled receptor n=1 Tax=Caenorhabditis tropicalis TaxID=1561998 RepID=A0A1I7TUG0_9PELO